ncbi:MAG: hypothetical protein ACJ79S_11975 [Gemmatimonadaceae bacterium]
MSANASAPASANATRGAPASATTPAREVRLELLVGRKVSDVAGETIGRIEEVCAELDGAEYVVREFHVGRLAVLERLFGGPLLRAVARTLTGDRIWRGYAVDWRDMDLADPERPRVRRRREELRELGPV